MIRTAVIGTGHAARLQLAAARTAAPDLEIAAIGGRNRAAVEALAATAGPGVAVMTPDEAVRSPAIDAVILAVPASVQPALAVAAFASGKHVLCEKPLAPTADAACAIARAWHAAGTIGMVNFGYRLIPALVEFRRQLDAGVCGDLSWIEAEWVLSSRLDPSLPFNWKADAAAGGGALRNFGSHVFDYLFHGKAGRVAAAWQRTLTATRRDEAGIVQPATADEILTAMFDVEGWCPVVVHISLVTRQTLGHHVVARGSAGALVAWNASPTSPAGPFKCVFSSGPVIENGVAAPVAGRHSDLSALFGAVVSRFAGAIAGRDEPVPGIDAGVRAAEWVDAVSAAASRW